MVYLTWLQYIFIIVHHKFIILLTSFVLLSPESGSCLSYVDHLLFWNRIWVNWTLRGTGLRISAYRILVHDFSKFSCSHRSFSRMFFFYLSLSYLKSNWVFCFAASELPGYAYNFCGEGKGKPRSEIFARAWKHHYLSNDHHHQYWMDYKTGKYKPMAGTRFFFFVCRIP
jgi:hypothetical protein